MPNFDQSKILIDASPLRYLNTGLGQFTFHLLDELSLLSMSDCRLVAVVHPQYRGLVPKGILIKEATWLHRHAPLGVQRHLYGPCKIWHMTTENTRLTGTPSNAALVLTVHGLHFLDEESEKIAELQLKNIQKLVNQAEVITVVSAYTANLMRERLNMGSRAIRIIPNGVSFSDSLLAKPVWAPQKKFLFSIGTFFKRKNLHVLIPMMKLLPDYTLVLAGDTHHDYGAFVFDRIKEEGMEDSIVVTGEISNVETNWLYENGEALLFPSVSEGFGIPLIESFQKGTPVFCSRFGSLPEVGSDHAYYWDNFDPQQMANLVKEKLPETSMAARTERIKYASQFTWSSVAKAYMDIYRSLLNS